MKKVALSLLALALGSAAFAEDQVGGTTFGSSPSLEVSASASWGYDLDTSVHGFSNAVTSKLTLWFLNGTSDKTGTGDPHGYISVADVKLGYDGAAAGGVVALSFGDVTAKIVAGDLYVKLYTNTDPSIDYNFDADNDSGQPNDTYYTSNGVYGAQTEWNFANIGGEVSTFAGKGIEVGYTSAGVFGLVVGIASHDDWSVAEQSGYEGSAEISWLGTEKLTAKVKGYVGAAAENVQGAGVTVGYDLGILAPFTNLNYNLTAETYTVDFGAKGSLGVDGVTLLALATYADTEVVDALVTVDLAEGKVAGPLSAHIGAKLLDVTTDVENGLAAEYFLNVGFKASDVVKVYGTVDTYNAAGSADSSLYLKAGLDYTGISLTTISLNWDSSDLGATESTGDSKNGKVVVTAKVAY
jgi:hypothetical protein